MDSGPPNNVLIVLGHCCLSSQQCPSQETRVLSSTTNHHFHLNCCCPLYSKEIHIRINASQKPSIIFDLSVNLDYPPAVTMMLSFSQQCRVQLINNKKGWGKDRTACLAPSHISTSWDTRAKISTQSVRLHQGVFNTVLSLEHPLPTLPPHVTPVPFILRAPFQISCHSVLLPSPFLWHLCSPLMVPLPGPWLRFTPSCVHLWAFEARMHKGQRVCGICLYELRSFPLMHWYQDLFLPCKFYNRCWWGNEGGQAGVGTMRNSMRM